METARDMTTQRLLGGHPAMDFINSAYGEGEEEFFERLCSYDDVVAWGLHAGIISGREAKRLLAEGRTHSAESHKAHRRALSVRGALEEVFRALAKGGRPPERALELLRDAQSEALHRAELRRGDAGPYEWVWTDADDLGRVLWSVVTAATRLLTSGEFERVKVCAACPWMFFDASKNRSRRWCSMEEGCGGEAKMRTYVARRAARRRTPSA
jgi:predicted RNA-binding Zn ribbon-like protein